MVSTQPQYTLLPDYPDSIELTLELRPAIHNLLRKLTAGLSELTFANLYLFHRTHQYRISKVEHNVLLVTGANQRNSFFVTPLELPSRKTLDRLFDVKNSMKCVTED